MGLFDKLKQGLSKTWKSLNTDIRDLLKSEGRLVDDAFLDELRAKLLGLLQAPATKIARIMKEPGAKLARVVQAKSAQEAKTA